MIEIAGDRDAIENLDLLKVKSHLMNNYVSVKTNCPMTYKQVFINFNYNGPIHQLSLHDEFLVYELHDQVDFQTSFHLYQLPCKAFYSLYEHLYYKYNIKQSLLNFVESVSLFARTGKTSLAKAIAQKIAINRPSVLVEIKTNSLLSKFYSESSKLVLKVFESIYELIKSQFVVVLMDEVESLTAARKTAVSGLEPSDAIRVVNTILTQIDKLQTKSNVLVIATSNITEAIDEAFLDRADMTLLIDNPSSEAIYQILYNGLKELHEKEMILDMVINCDELWNICKELERRNTSARKVGKMILMAHAKTIRKPQAFYHEYLEALAKLD
ncbi:Pachytene checkpoint protein 2 [Boothiomyces sp. JEL0866]|nr:Pachytene checkpoint protein 2 [Boothiomyces sp. JEL0866]